MPAGAAADEVSGSGQRCAGGGAHRPSYQIGGRTNRSTMQIQYVYDADGHRTGVLVPIDLWEATVGTIEPHRRCRFKDVHGIYRDLVCDPDAVASAPPGWVGAGIGPPGGYEHPRPCARGRPAGGGRGRHRTDRIGRPTARVADRAIDLGRSSGISPPDAVIAATALESDSVLVRRNVRDFRGIDGLHLFNPLRRNGLRRPHGSARDRRAVRVVDVPWPCEDLALSPIPK